MITLDKVLISPITTEKTTSLKNKAVFKIASKSSKEDVKKAVQEFYGVEVKGINIVNLPEKIRLVGRGRPARKRAPFKKAIVSLKEGTTIDFNAFK
ncbi:50S ribosomal protein L23 [Candidatus Gracilibacteria bacterium]|nr:50S ribosomal protein L23 [Candidatus Gracilibacteria bacterium]